MTVAAKKQKVDEMIEAVAETQAVLDEAEAEYRRLEASLDVEDVDRLMDQEREVEKARRVLRLAEQRLQDANADHRKVEEAEAAKARREAEAEARQLTVEVVDLYEQFVDRAERLRAANRRAGNTSISANVPPTPLHALDLWMRRRR